MGTLIRNIPLAGALLVGSLVARSGTTNTPLTFYVVSEEKTTDSARFLNSTALPNVGDISSKPDLIVTNLQDVFPQKTIPPRPTLAVAPHSADAKRVMALSQQAPGKRLLVMLGDRRLSAPIVRAPIESGSFVIEFRSQTELKRTEDDLKKLVQRKNG